MKRILSLVALASLPFLALGCHQAKPEEQIPIVIVVEKESLDAIANKIEADLRNNAKDQDSPNLLFKIAEKLYEQYQSIKNKFPFVERFRYLHQILDHIREAAEQSPLPLDPEIEANYTDLATRVNYEISSSCLEEAKNYANNGQIAEMLNLLSQGLKHNPDKSRVKADEIARIGFRRALDQEYKTIREYLIEAKNKLDTKSEHKRYDNQLAVLILISNNVENVSKYSNAARLIGLHDVVDFERAFTQFGREFKGLFDAVKYISLVRESFTAPDELLEPNLRRDYKSQYNPRV